MHRAGWFLALALAISSLTQTATAKTYGQTLCKYEGFHCVKVKKGASWTSMFPDEHERDIAMRVNRMNTPVWAGQIIAVPNEIATANIMDFSPFPQQTNTGGEKLIVIDPLHMAWGAYDTSGSLVRWGPASAGADFCRDIGHECRTHSGSYRAYTMGSSDCYSSKFPLPNGGAPMPYCIYFNKGQALHGEPHGLPGHNASHGCVRTYVNDAEWLRYNFIEGPNEMNDNRGTLVIVKEYYS